MPRALTIAAVQMKAEPAPIAERLTRAEKHIAAAAQQGAQLVVLPKLFNLGWDAAHPELWAQYAGRVDAVAISSCPPRAHDLTVKFPDGDELHAAAAGPAFQQVARQAEHIFDSGIRGYGAWLGVPIVNTVGTGVYDTSVPMPRLSLGSYLLMRPDQWRHFADLDQARVTSDYNQGALVADANGQTLALMPKNDEGFVIATVPLADATPPAPTAPVPPPSAPWLAYAFDDFANALLSLRYRREARRYVGAHMAPVKRETKRWLGAVLVALGLGLWLGRMRRRR